MVVGVGGWLNIYWLALHLGINRKEVTKEVHQGESKCIGKVHLDSEYTGITGDLPYNHKHTHPHTHKHTHIPTHKHVHTLTHTHKHAHTHTRAHTHTHTHTHTHQGGFPPSFDSYQPIVAFTKSQSPKTWLIIKMQFQNRPFAGGRLQLVCDRVLSLGFLLKSFFLQLALHYIHHLLLLHPCTNKIISNLLNI